MNLRSAASRCSYSPALILVRSVVPTRPEPSASVGMAPPCVPTVGNPCRRALARRRPGPGSLLHEGSIGFEDSGQVTVTRTLANPELWSRRRIAWLFDDDRSAVSVVTIQPKKYCPGG